MLRYKVDKYRKKETAGPSPSNISSVGTECFSHVALWVISRRHHGLLCFLVPSSLPAFPSLSPPVPFSFSQEFYFSGLSSNMTIPEKPSLVIFCSLAVPHRHNCLCNCHFACLEFLLDCMLCDSKICFFFPLETSVPYRRYILNKYLLNGYTSSSPEDPIKVQILIL